MEIEITYLISKKKGWKTFIKKVNEIQLEKWYNNNLPEYVKNAACEKANNNVPYRWKIVPSEKE
jgi:hypothetical protein